jgi:nitrite reductase (cytochrome c-552)
MDLAENSLVAAHVEAKAAWDAGATEPEMKAALTAIRHAQWRWDWVAAANGVGFHAPLEAARVLGTSIEKAQTARRELARVLWSRGVTNTVALPDIRTKEAAQLSVGLAMDKLHAEKVEFLKTVVPQWDAAAREREARLPEAPREQGARYGSEGK